jgi:hexaprenyl-diphosphate synthase
MRRFLSSSSSWSTSISSSHSLVNPSSLSSILSTDLLSTNIQSLLSTNHPFLKTLSSYYFKQKGKHLRPLLVLLISKASNNPTTISTTIPTNIHSPLSKYSSSPFSSPSYPQNDGILPSQRRLSEIIEMIHTASLLHDDVIDHSLVRRASKTVNAEYGNKLAILSGDFLLARASLALSRLADPRVIELIADIISDLVQGFSSSSLFYNC